jgi:thymidine phosphorylase
MVVAEASLLLGAGRANASATVDHAVGITGLVKIGERVRRGGRLCTIHANDEALLAAALKHTRAAFKIGARPAAQPALIDALIT